MKLKQTNRQLGEAAIHTRVRHADHLVDPAARVCGCCAEAEDRYTLSATPMRMRPVTAVK